MSVIDDAILQLGDDALSNQWMCIFIDGIPGGGNTEAIAMRMDQSFDPPQKTIATYDIDFRGSKIRKTSKKEDTTKEFTIAIRIDQQWTVYDALSKWVKMVYDPARNNAVSDALCRKNITIQNIDGSNNVMKSFKYTYCKPFQLKVTTMDQTSGDPLRVEVTFMYGDEDDGVTV